MSKGGESNMETAVEQTEFVEEVPKPKKSKTSETPRRRRVTFYIWPKGSSRRKKVSFLVRR